MSGRSWRRMSLRFVVALGDVRVVAGVDEQGVMEKGKLATGVALGGVRVVVRARHHEERQSWDLLSPWVRCA